MLKVELDVRGVTKRFGLTSGGSVHQRLNTVVLNRCEPYIPKKSGALIASGGSGGGYLFWNVSYAKKQYYENKGSGLRGRLWFERMWMSQKGKIISELNAFATGNASNGYAGNIQIFALGAEKLRSNRFGGRIWL